MAGSETKTAGAAHRWHGRGTGLLSAILLIAVATITAHAQTREEKVRKDREKVEAEGFWIYNDLPAGFEKARSTGKPLLVVLRCIPCEECVKLDDELVDRDPVIRPLLERFVCVRQVSTNGLDLGLFQFDTDQSFAVFLLNADGTIYGRFGTRSHRTDWLFDVSLPGLARALEGALELHAGYPGNREQLAGKRGTPLEFGSPEKYPSLKDRYQSTLAKTGNVVKSCIHCHQIGDAQRQLYREKGQPIPESILFPYPHPKSLGLILDPEQRSTVKTVAAGSLAEHAGFRPGDEIVSLAGQPLVSIADVQWVLQRTPAEGGTLEAEVRTGDARRTLQWTLPKGWRRAGDLSWRASAWGLRRMTTGGMRLIAADEAIRKELKIAPEEMALEVEYMGQYGEHAAAKRAGFLVDDVLISVDGQTDLRRESDLFRYAVTARKPGDRLRVELVRGGKRMTLELPQQK